MKVKLRWSLNGPGYSTQAVMLLEITIQLDNDIDHRFSHILFKSLLGWDFFCVQLVDVILRIVHDSLL